MKHIITLCLVIISFCLHAQNPKSDLSRLYEKQANDFYNRDFQSALAVYDSIQFLANAVSDESLELAIASCEELLKTAKEGEVEILITRKEYLVALQKWRKINTAKPQFKFEATQVDVFRERYNKNAVYFKVNGAVMGNNEKLTMSQLKKTLQSFEESNKELELYTKNRRIGMGLLAGALASYVAAVAVAPKNKALSDGMFTIALTTEIVALPFALKATTHLNRSVWHYNREVAIKE
jgi:hypothetical protein